MPDPRRASAQLSLQSVAVQLGQSPVAPPMSIPHTYAQTNWFGAPVPTQESGEQQTVSVAPSAFGQLPPSATHVAVAVGVAV